MSASFSTTTLVGNDVKPEPVRSTEPSVLPSRRVPRPPGPYPYVAPHTWVTVFATKNPQDATSPVLEALAALPVVDPAAFEFDNESSLDDVADYIAQRLASHYKLFFPHFQGESYGRNACEHAFTVVSTTGMPSGVIFIRCDEYQHVFIADALTLTVDMLVAQTAPYHILLETLIEKLTGTSHAQINRNNVGRYEIALAEKIEELGERAVPMVYVYRRNPLYEHFLAIVQRLFQIVNATYAIDYDMTALLLTQQIERLFLTDIENANSIIPLKWCRDFFDRFWRPFLEETLAERIRMLESFEELSHSQQFSLELAELLRPTNLTRVYQQPTTAAVNDDDDDNSGGAQSDDMPYPFNYKLPKVPVPLD